MILKKRNFIDNKEIFAVKKVLQSGILSKYLGEPGKLFNGGPKVKLFEKKIQKYFKVNHALVVNSWTSGLICAVGALDIEPGDEIIVPPWTMSACITSILFWNAIPIFADIEKDYYTISPSEIEKKITKKTKAIISVDIFGQSADMEKINKIAKKYKLKVISDTAQAIGSKYNGKFSGTLADIGGFSLNYHKHIHTGEGGILVTNNKKYADKMRLIRNHGESVIKKSANKKDLINSFGFNFRMGEIEAAIGIEQLKKLKKILNKNIETANLFKKEFSQLKGLSIPKIRNKATHVYYIYPMLIDQKKCKFSKYELQNFLEKEGIYIGVDYVNLHLLPMFKHKIAYGKKNFPWSLSNRKLIYKEGICPIAESYKKKNFICFSMCEYDYSKKNIKLIAKKIKEFWKKNSN
jgi:dTDP-4-amino-4,6-dideoxygalactose transaminase